MAKTRWGILSTANIGRRAMIPALKKSPMAEILAVASRDEGRARQFANELDIPRSYGDYQALLDDEEIDAVYNPLPNHLHKEWSIRAAEAGKHILCEKPLALDPEESCQMIAAAESNGVELMESFMYRHHPRILEAREMIRSGVIGSPKTIVSAFTFKLTNKDDIRYQPQMGGGALMDVGCYCVNISRLMAGREPVTVQARAAWASTGVDEQLTGIMDFGEGLVAHFDCGFNQSDRQHFTVAGTDAYLDIPMPFLPGLGETVIHEERGGNNAKVHKFPGVDEYRMIAEDFMGAIAGGSPTFPIEDSFANMKVIQALLSSAKQGGNPIPL